MFTRILIPILFAALCSCSIFDKQTRLHHKQLRTQVIPPDILNTTWILTEGPSDKNPCLFKITFRDKGKFITVFKDYPMEGWYTISGDTLDIYTGMPRKVLWIGDEECTFNPEIFSTALNYGVLTYQINGVFLSVTSHKGVFKFKKA